MHTSPGVHAFNTAWTTLHTSQEPIHILRKWPQDILRSEQPLVKVSFKFKVAKRNYVKFYQILA
jgi:hypothetical protein